MIEEETTQLDQFKIAKLELRDGDVLVVMPQSHTITQRHVEMLESYIKRTVSKNIDLLILAEPMNLAVLSPEAKVIRRCKDCVHWGKQQQNDEFIAVDARPCNYSAADSRAMGFDDFAIAFRHDSPVYCGPNFGCVNFGQGEDNC